MAHKRKDIKQTRRASDDILQSLRELAKAIEGGVPLQALFTVRTMNIPEPGKYSPATVRKLRMQLGISQAVFAELLGVSRVWVQGWERGVRQPSLLARRLMDTIRVNPAAWLTTVWSKAS